MTPAGTWFGWIESTAPAEAIRTSLWLYPAIQTAHITGIILLAGSAILFDLRLLGLSRTIPVHSLAKHTLPWSMVGFALAVSSGSLLFISHATDWIENPLFTLKMILIIAAGVNAAVFHGRTMKNIHRWNTDVRPPVQAYISAVLSLCLWLTIVAAGRLLAYY